MMPAVIRFSGILSFIIIFNMVHQTISAAERCPCDIYANGKTPCVAAHSTVRALYSLYNGPLYQVRRASDNKTKDIGVLTLGGLVNSAVQDSFLIGTTGTISIIYDQSGNGNNLTSAPGGEAVGDSDKEVTADRSRFKINGNTAYAAYFEGGMGYRNNKTSGIATGDQPEGLYMVTSGKHFNNKCCFDYGNAETTNNDDCAGTMEAIYFGNSTEWGKGSGSGPWVMADLENGLFGGTDFNANTANISLTNDYVTATLKGKSHFWAIKGGNSQSGKLSTLYNGTRPAQKDWPTNCGYDPMRKQGAIILGIGGDNSNWSVGTFYEGAMTSGYPSDSTENAVQANIVSAGYGSNVTSISYSTGKTLNVSNFSANYNPLNGKAVIGYNVQDTRHVDITIVDQCGRRVAEIVNGVVPGGSHTAVWDAKRAPSGVYLCKVVIDKTEMRAGKIVVGR